MTKDNIFRVHNLLTSCLLLLSGCSLETQPKIIITGEEYIYPQWSNEDLQQQIAAHNLHESVDSSSHLIRLNGREQPHYHDRHDLYVSVVSGKSTIHFREHSINLDAGAFVIIPRGTYHWAESRGNEASILVTIFSPAFDGKDKRKAE